MTETELATLIANGMIEAGDELAHQGKTFNSPMALVAEVGKRVAARVFAQEPIGALRAEHTALHAYLVGLLTHNETAQAYSDLVAAHDDVAIADGFDAPSLYRDGGTKTTAETEGRLEADKASGVTVLADGSHRQDGICICECPIEQVIFPEINVSTGWHHTGPGVFDHEAEPKVVTSPLVVPIIWRTEPPEMGVGFKVMEATWEGGVRIITKIELTGAATTATEALEEDSEFGTCHVLSEPHHETPLCHGWEPMTASESEDAP